MKLDGIKAYIRLMMKPGLALFVMLSIVPAYAQLSGSRDLTAFWRAPDDHVASPSSAACSATKSTMSDGAVVNGVPTEAAKAEKPDNIEFIITKILPATLHVGEDFTATLRLKNLGATPLRIPWQPDGEQVTRLSADGSEQYEVADVDFHLSTAGKTGPPMPLESEGALFAHPSDSSTYFVVEPGRWVEITVKGSVTCGLFHCIGEIEPDAHAKLTAFWYQRLLTHRVNGCNEDHGAYTVRELNSAPLDVSVQSPAGSNDSHHPPSPHDSTPHPPEKRVVPQVQSQSSPLKS